MEESNLKSIKDNLEPVEVLSVINPEEFKREKRKAIDRVIDNANPRYQAKLLGVQFKIDKTLAKYRNPIVRMNKMVELFWDGVSTFENTLNGKFLNNNVGTSAEIIPFSQKINKL